MKRKISHFNSLLSFMVNTLYISHRNGSECTMAYQHNWHFSFRHFFMYLKHNYSKESILQYFRPSLRYHLSLGPLFCLFLSGHLRQVLLYFYKEIIFLLYNSDNLEWGDIFGAVHPFVYGLLRRCNDSVYPKKIETIR